MVEDLSSPEETDNKEEKMETCIPNMEVSNKYQVLTEPDKDEPNTSNEVIKPPPIVIREEKHWPNINETLKNFGMNSEKNVNTRDGIRMILPSMEIYNKCTSTLDQYKIQYHTFNKPQSPIAKELQDKGFTARIVARFKNRNGQNMPIILVIVTDDQDKIKNITQICDMEVRFEHQRKTKRLGQCYNCQRFGHSAYNCKADPVCKHESRMWQMRGPAQIQLPRMP
ncbi:hypothetical protein JTB14_031610 [Gonioctena quinquepunctata]|nr:hypothetical protein JTB14_031610 [Gonioctena quinquepunctata]